MLALLLLQVAAPAPSAWHALPPLPIQPPASDLAGTERYVASEVAAGRCPAPGVGARGLAALAVTAVVRLGEDGRVVAVRPAAIGCPTVEQYTAGVIQRLVDRAHYTTRPVAAGWYRTRLTYRWTPGAAPTP